MSKLKDDHNPQPIPFCVGYFHFMRELAWTVILFASPHSWDDNYAPPYPALDEMGSHERFARAGLKLSTSASQIAGITGLSHCASPTVETRSHS
jgi:hypothetical protein